MQMNMVTTFRYVTERMEAERLIQPILERRPDLMAEVRTAHDRGPTGPSWTAVGWSGDDAEFGKHEFLEQAVLYELEQSGIADRFNQ